MVMTITKIGDSQGIIFDTTLLDMAHLRAGDQVNIVVHEGGTITITPIRPRVTRDEVSKVIDGVLDDYATTLQKLA